MGINFSTFRIEHPNPAPIPVGGTILSLTDRNTIIMLDAIGICASIERDGMTIQRFLPVAQNWLQDHNRPTEVIATRMQAQRQNVINIDTAAGYIAQQLAQIVEMITEAQQAGATHLYWWKP